MLISFEVTAKLICGFVFAYAKCRFSHDAAHLVVKELSFLHGDSQESDQTKTQSCGSFYKVLKDI